MDGTPGSRQLMFSTLPQLLISPKSSVRLPSDPSGPLRLMTWALRALEFGRSHLAHWFIHLAVFQSFGWPM
ncbi:unnamed protein product [Caenorhabditis auriculariae]|uniref:Uncharacterized protein n=1 Tax=Caenorhabditis auriculariae TaxID=2777116 RepID=A0A8S1HR15_9PELO|nr:unnamed protein product [Caenorhabditis auriculariae]